MEKIPLEAPVSYTLNKKLPEDRQRRFTRDKSRPTNLVAFHHGITALEHEIRTDIIDLILWKRFFTVLHYSLGSYYRGEEWI